MALKTRRHLEKALEVPTRPRRRGIVVAIIRRNLVEVQCNRELIQAINTHLPPRVGLPVTVEWNGAAWEVTDVDYLALGGSAPQHHMVPPHAESHTLGHPEGGDDPVWIVKEQLLSLTIAPTDPPSTRVRVHRGTLILNQKIKEFTGSFVDFTAAIAGLTTSAEALVYLSPDSMMPEFILGTSRPEVPPHSVPLAIIKLYPGQSQITWDHIIDAREIPPFVPATNLGQLQDVCASNPADRDFLMWMAASSCWGAGRPQLADLEDTCISAPEDGQALCWDAASSCWRNLTISGGGGGFPTGPFIIRSGSVLTFTTVQAAINEAQAGEHIYVPAGLYEESLVIPSGKNGIAIVGLAGVGSARIRSTGAPVLTAASNFRLTNLWLGHEPTDSGRIAIDCDSSISPLMDGCEIDVTPTAYASTGIRARWITLRFTSFMAAGSAGFTAFELVGTNEQVVFAHRTRIYSGGELVICTGTGGSCVLTLCDLESLSGSISFGTSVSVHLRGTVSTPPFSPAANVIWEPFPLSGGPDGCWLPIWQNGAWSVGELTLDQLADVVAPSPAIGDVLTYNGANWVPQSTSGGSFPVTPFIIRSGTVIVYPDFATAVENAQSGDWICLPPGQFIVDADMSISQSVWVVGIGSPVLALTNGHAIGISANVTIDRVNVSFSRSTGQQNVILHLIGGSLSIRNSVISVNDVEDHTTIPFDVLGTATKLEVTNVVIASNRTLNGIVYVQNTYPDIYMTNVVAPHSYVMLGGSGGAGNLVLTNVHAPAVVDVINLAQGYNESASAFNNCNFLPCGIANRAFGVPFAGAPESGGTILYDNGWRIQQDTRAFVFVFTGTPEPGTQFQLNQIRYMTVRRVTAALAEAADETIYITVYIGTSYEIGVTIPTGDTFAETIPGVPVPFGLDDRAVVEVSTSATTGKDLVVTISAA